MTENKKYDSSSFDKPAGDGPDRRTESRKDCWGREEAFGRAEGSFDLPAQGRTPSGEGHTEGVLDKREEHPLSKSSLEKKSQKHGTIFDDVFRTMVQKMPQLLIPLINEVFRTDYSPEEAFEQYRNEHEEVFGKVITDSIIIIRNKTYHIECQSMDDMTMAIRMVEYDFAIALEQSIRNGRMYEMNFPDSCVLYLRSTQNTPGALQVKVNLPGGDSFVYEAKTIKLSDYTRKDIFEKHLLLLLPYYILKYEKDAERIASDEKKLRELLADYEEIRKQLETELLRDEKSVLYTDMVALIVTISDHVFAARETVRKGVTETMGGKVLKLRSEELREEGWQAGLAEGLETGKAVGLAEGLETGKAEVFQIISEITHGNNTLESLLALGYSWETCIQALRASGLLSETED